MERMKARRQTRCLTLNFGRFIPTTAAALRGECAPLVEGGNKMRDKMRGVDDVGARLRDSRRTIERQEADWRKLAPVERILRQVPSRLVALELRPRFQDDAAWVCELVRRKLLTVEQARRADFEIDGASR
jgi:hypothetical protein